jgi:hypothetical protein
LSGRGLFEESQEVLVSVFSVFSGHGTICRDFVFCAVLGPDGVSELDTSLTDRD